MRCLLSLLCVLAMGVPAVAVDTDGDGLLDLMDVEGFDPNRNDTSFAHSRIEDLDGVNLLRDHQEIALPFNDVTSIDPGDFEGLINLRSLSLNSNQITSIDADDFKGLSSLSRLALADNQIEIIGRGAFRELTNLTELRLDDNPLSEIRNGAFQGLKKLRRLWFYGTQLSILNFTGAEFEDLQICPLLEGFCGVSDNAESLILDNATLSHRSLVAIFWHPSLGGLPIREASLVGLNFSDEYPPDLSRLLNTTTLDNVIIDQSLFDQYADEFNAFAAIEGKTVTVVPGLCDVNRDTVCDITDIDQMLQNVLSVGRFTDEDLQLLIHREMPHGFNTYFGDANLDGQLNSDDLVTVLAAGQYEDDVVGNSTWPTGDWNGDAEFTSDDLVTALADGGYEAGPRPAAVPEPSAIVLMLLGLLATGPRLRCRRAQNALR